MTLIKGKFLTVIPENTSDFLKLSVSKVKTFKSCKAKFFFSYIKKLPKKEWEFQVFGSFLHEVLERFEQSILDGCKDADNLILTKVFKDTLNGEPFKDSPKEDMTVWKDKLKPEQKTECKEILSNFLELRKVQKLNNSLPTVIQTEKPFNINLDGKILLNGYIDLLQRDVDGVLHVADYKTSKDSKYLKKDFMQLKTYAYALCLEDPTLEKVRASYVMLRQNFNLITIEFTREDVMSSEDEFLEFAKEIEDEKLYRPTTSPLCKYCDYLNHCDDGKRKVGISFGETDWI